MKRKQDALDGVLELAKNSKRLVGSSRVVFVEYLKILAAEISNI